MAEDRIDKHLERSLDRAIGEFLKEVVTEIGKELIESTPIDVGTAKSNWRASVGFPDLSEPIDAWAPGSRGSTASANISAATADLSNRIPLTAAKGTEIFYLANTLDYIRLLDAGHSKQAPKGFIKNAVRQAARRLKEKK